MARPLASPANRPVIVSLGDPAPWAPPATLSSGQVLPGPKHKAPPKGSVKAALQDSLLTVPHAIAGAASVAKLTNSEEVSAATREEAAAECRRQDFRVHAEVQRKEARGTDKQLDREWSLCGGWLASPKAWWRHPVARLVVPWLVLLQDFYIYGEDPLNDSHVQANYPGMGHVMGILTVWAAPTVAFGFLRLLFALGSISGGIVAGRWLGRVALAKWCNISAFQGSEGQLVTVPMVTCLFLAVSAVLYSLVTGDTIDGASMEMFYVLGAPNLQYRTVAKYFQTLSVTVDFLAIVLISDQIMQDFYRYPDWANGAKKWWLKKWKGWARILLTWVFLLATVIAATLGIFSTGKGEADMRWTNTVLGGTTETTRSFLAALIIFTDLVTTAQDWDFPIYREPLDVAVPTLVAGTNLEQLVIGIPERCTSVLREALTAVSCCGLWELLPSADWFAITIRGKWLAYGPLLGVMGVDLLCAKTQVLYNPGYYGQYVSPDNGRIWVIVDEDYLAQAYTRGNLRDDAEELVSYATRRDLSTGLPLDESAATDVLLNTRYVESNGLHYCFFLLGIAFLISFGLMLKWADWRRARLIDRARLKLTKVTTSLAAQAEEGCSTLQLVSDKGFCVGDTVEVCGHGSEVERSKIASLNPTTLETPMMQRHPAGSSVEKVVVRLDGSQALTEGSLALTGLSSTRSERFSVGRRGQSDEAQSDHRLQL